MASQYASHISVCQSLLTFHRNIGFTLADLHETALKKIKEEFAEQLSEDEYKVLLDTKAPSEVFENLHSDEFEAGKGRRVLEKSLANLERFESALDALTGSMPEFVGLNLVGLIWGGMKFVIVASRCGRDVLRGWS